MNSTKELSTTRKKRKFIGNLNMYQKAALAIPMGGAGAVLVSLPGLLQTSTIMAIAGTLLVTLAAKLSLPDRVPEKSLELTSIPTVSTDFAVEGLSMGVKQLHSIAEIYEKRQSPLLPTIGGVLTNIQELFNRIDRRESTQASRLAAVEYADVLEKLNRALGKDYYLDIESHPELWSNPDERMEAVERALNATGEQLVKNIRQLNSSKDLVYQVSIDALINRGTEDAAKVLEA